MDGWVDGQRTVTAQVWFLLFRKELIPPYKSMCAQQAHISSSVPYILMCTSMNVCRCHQFLSPWKPGTTSAFHSAFS